MAIRDRNKALRNPVGDVELCSAMVRLASLALSKTDPDRIISEALKEIRKTLGARICWMSLVEEDRVILKGLGEAGSRRGPAGSELLLKLSPKMLKRTYPIICNRVGELYKENRVLHRFLHQRNIQKFMGIPLKKDGRSIGVLNLGRGRGARDFTREDLKSLTMLGSVLVISRLRAAERESRQAQSFLEAIIDNIPNAIFIKDRKHRWVVLNQVVARLTGYPREKMLGKSDYDFFPKDQADFFWKKDEQMFRTGKVVDVPEEPITDSEGNVHYLHTKKAPLRDSSGKITHLVGIIEDVTERKRADSALQESEEKHRLLVENIKEGIFSTDQGIFTTVNESMCRMFGFSKQEFIGMRSWNLAVPQTRNSARDMFREKVAKHDYSPAEVKCLRKDGSVFVAEIRLSAISGERVSLGTVSDITERKKSEGALKESEEKYRLLIESSDAAITFFDKNGTYLFLNSLAANWLKGKPEDYIGKTVYDTFPKSLAGMFVKRFRRIIKSGVGETIEEVVEQPLGGRFISSNLQPVRDQNGKIAGVQIVTHDITERKRAEEALRGSENKYRMLLENLPQRIFFKDENSVYISCNDNFAQDLNIKPDEITGKTDYDFFPKKLAEKYETDDKRIMESGEIEDIEEVYIQDGKEVFVHTVKTPIKDENGNIVGILGIFWDVTERKRAEEALQKSEGRYRSLFEDSPISLWEEDFSGVKKYIDRLRDSGIKDFRQHFESHPKAVAKCASMVKLIDVNRASLKLYKARNKEELKSGLTKIFARESYYPFTEELITIAEGRTRFEKEAEARTLTGDRRRLSVTWSVAPGHQETLSKVVVAITDVTEAKEAEDALRREEERYRTLVETAQEGIGIVDSKENLLFVNRAFAGLLGYQKDELLGKNLKEISDSTQYDVFREETKKRKQGQPSKYEITLPTKRGKPKPMYLSAAPLWNADGSFRGTLGVLSDLTEIKKAREYNVLLNASRSLSRTLKFDQVLKLGAEKMAQALNADRCTVMLPGNEASGSSIQVQVYPFPNIGKDSLSTWSLKITREHLSSYKRSLQAQGSIQIDSLHSDLVPTLGKKIVHRSSMVSALIVPMFLRNKMLGVFHVGMRRKARTFTTDEVRLARTMANQVTVALQNCELIEDVRKEHSQIVEQAQLLAIRYREQKMMFELTRALSSSRNLDRLLSSACRKVAELLNTERCSISLLDHPGGESGTVRAVHVRGKRRPGRFVGTTFTFDAYPGLKDVALRHKPFVLPDASLLPKGDPVRGYFLRRGMKSTVAVPLLSRGKCLGFLTVASMTEAHHYTKDEIRLLQTISNSIAVTIENYRLLEDLKQKYAQIREQTQTLEKRTREQDILLRVSQALSQAMDLDEVSQVGSRVVGSALGAERCAVCLVREDGQQFEIRGLYSKEPADGRKLLKTRFPWNDVPHLMKTIKKEKPFFIDDTSDFPSTSKTREHFRKTGIKTVLGTGMFFGKKLVGLLSVTGVTQRRVFSQEEVRLIQTMANQIAVAVENARLQRVVEKHAQDLKDLYSQLLKTQENERKKIAQELHDQVGQMLQSMKMNLDWMKRGMTSKPQKLERMEDWLLDTEALLGQTIDDIRNLTFELRPSMLDDFGLIPALRWYVDNYARRSSVKVSLKTRDKEYRFPPEVVITLYRIIQEALTNVAKHARATQASVSVSRKGSTAVLSVRDNGIGFDSGKWLSAPKGMGLLNIKERVDMLGGDFEVISRPRKGTKLNIQIPFQEVQYEEDQTPGGRRP